MKTSGVFIRTRRLKFSGIAAAAAQIFGGFAAAEAVYHGFGTGGGQNVRKVFFEYIAQADHAVTV